MLDHVVAASCRDHLLVVDVDQAWDLPDRSAVTPQLIGVNDLRDIVFTQKPGQEGFRGLDVAVALQQNFEHEAVLVHCPPQPVSDAIDARTHLVQMPPGTPTGFPVAKLFGKEGRELDAPFAEGLVTHLNAALMQQFLDSPVTQRKAVVQPDRVLDDGHRETVAVGLGVGHGQSAYPDPVKANAGKLRR